MLILRNLPWNYIISPQAMNLHKILVFSWIFMKWNENHEIWCTPAPGLRNSMYYCTILHDLGSSFRWIPIIFMIFHEIHWFPRNHHKIIKGADFAVLVRNSMIHPKKGMRIPVHSLVYSKSYGPGREGYYFWPRTHEFHHFSACSWCFVNFMDFRKIQDFRWIC